MKRKHLKKKNFKSEMSTKIVLDLQNIKKFYFNSSKCFIGLQKITDSFLREKISKT